MFMPTILNLIIFVFYFSNVSPIPKSGEKGCNTLIIVWLFIWCNVLKKKKNETVWKQQASLTYGHGKDSSIPLFSLIGWNFSQSKGFRVGGLIKADYGRRECASITLRSFQWWLHHGSTAASSSSICRHACASTNSLLTGEWHWRQDLFMTYHGFLISDSWHVHLGDYWCIVTV